MQTIALLFLRGMTVTNLLFARPNGELLDLPAVKMIGKTGRVFVVPRKEELIPLPEGATLTALPYRVPLGFHEKTGKFISLDYNPYTKKDESVWTVGALLPQGFTRTLVPAFSTPRGQGALPLLGYTAVGVQQGKFFVAAVQTDEHLLWHPKHYNTKDLEERVKAKLRKYPHNRLVAQLGLCSLEYGCFTAQNIFYGRWEGGIPVSPLCNAGCLGCISSQPAECCPAPQRRLNFVPTVEEIVELAVDHLEKGQEAIVSFGQGCEGEPSLQADIIGESIRRIRKRVHQGTININTNAGDTDKIKKIVDSGIDSMRISMVSPTPHIYQAYHCPQNYSLNNVIDSLIYASKARVYTSLNLLAFPGFTDEVGEINRLIDFIKNTGIKKVQFRNLNIDPEIFLSLIPKRNYQAVGISEMIKILKQEISGLEIGNYSRPVLS